MSASTSYLCDCDRMTSHKPQDKIWDWKVGTGSCVAGLGAIWGSCPEMLCVWQREGVPMSVACVLAGWLNFTLLLALLLRSWRLNPTIFSRTSTNLTQGAAISGLCGLWTSSRALYHICCDGVNCSTAAMTLKMYSITRPRKRAFVQYAPGTESFEALKLSFGRDV
ncbi:hypothetical protein BC628DRAFT_1180615 [Trametes gibbosa]|nr:hypothetical protein BC628DRAFT_1180615 [Trametes gibbosa]